MANKKKWAMFLAVIAVISIILLIFYLKENGSSNEKTMQCIAENSVLYVSKICGHCSNQKEILGGYLNLFEVIDCIDQGEKCTNEGIMYVPTWVINGEKTSGVKSIEQLKELTGCE